MKRRLRAVSVTQPQSRRTRVCFVSPRAYALFNPQSPTVFGGAEVQFFQVATRLAQDPQFDVHVIVSDDEAGTEERNRVTIHRAYSLQRKAINYVKGPIAIYRALVTINPDVVLQRCAGPETAICAFYCRRHKKRFIFSSAHDIDVTGQYAKRGVLGKLYTYGFARADHIILTDKHLGNLLESWRGTRDKAKTVCIPPAYPFDTKLSVKKDMVLWVARSDAWKRPELFLALARAYPKTAFTMIMPKSNEVAVWESVQREAKTIPNLTLLDRVSFSDVQSYFDRALIFVNTSSQEGIPNTFIQSYLGRTPVVSVSVDVGDFFARSGGGIYCENNPSALIPTVGKLLTNTKLREQLGQRGWEFAKKHHDLEMVSALWAKTIGVELAPKTQVTARKPSLARKKSMPTSKRK